ncbi:DUF2796 domain-containing protein [Nitrosovibrio tenuis]|uniref:DUF2796 domain-containing protein n=1 Tax=Nitrosovibrio tenuis TaxID=1233 RepID=A0A1H7IXD3_9PROT|nr:DUF2796 domain-containing protein [Nitrosovibrio tenuis]SEK66320.1 Protein of unknown function [Nitrosovibrio tenuis]
MAEMKRASRWPGFSGRAAIITIAALVVATELMLPTCAYGAGPHVHGQATLEIAVDGPAVQINLNSPVDNLLGFEHAPRNEKERQAIRTMASKLHQPDSLFIFTPTAQCRLESSRLVSPQLPSELLLSRSGSSMGSDHSVLNNDNKLKVDKPSVDKPTGDKSPGLSPAPSAATSSRPTPAPSPSTQIVPSHGHADDHAELEATWDFRCATPQNLQGLDVRLFQLFPGLRRIDTAIVGPKGQSSVKLTPASTRLKW